MEDDRGLAGLLCEKIGEGGSLGNWWRKAGPRKIPFGATVASVAKEDVALKTHFHRDIDIKVLGEIERNRLRLDKLGLSFIRANIHLETAVQAAAAVVIPDFVVWIPVVNAPARVIIKRVDAVVGCGRIKIVAAVKGGKADVVTLNPPFIRVWWVGECKMRGDSRD